MSTSVVWFRKSLRLHDNPGLTQACEDSSVDFILPIFILDPKVVGEKFEKYGKNRIRFLLESLEDLDHSLVSKAKSPLFIFYGCPDEVVGSIIRSLGDQFSGLHSEYCSEPYGLQVTQKILDRQNDLPEPSFHFHPASHTLLDIESVIRSNGFKDPKSMKDISGIFSKVFPTEKDGFYSVPDPLPVPSRFKPAPTGFDLPSAPALFQCEVFSPSTLSSLLKDWGIGDFSNFENYFKGGETEALNRLQQKVSSQTDFVNTFRKPKTSSTNSDSNPLEPSTTGLSPYIATGSLSARLLWKEVERVNRTGNHSSPPESLHGQLLFREMFYLLSRSVPNWNEDQENPMCKNIDWGEPDESKLSAWEKGMTGFPLIDAMMRQLDSTGWMHHLGRHAVSCFLTRGQLWQHWKHGRDLFERKLLDSDWALNNANWLWLSGVAPFSMPYFRLYNPCPDGKSSLNVDAKTGQFIKHWVPELKDFPVQHIYEPHLTSEKIQQDANCIIGRDYPFPIVNRKESAKENLAHFKASLSKLSN